MVTLKNRILNDARCLPGGILKVDGLLNHQVDPQLMMQIAQEFAHRFSHIRADKILTVESSGIAPALLTAYLMNIPMVFAKKRIPVTMANNYHGAEVVSFTKGNSYQMVISCEYLTKGESVLFIDDFLAHGNTTRAILNICSGAGVVVSGFGIVIEKVFQGGGDWLRSQDYLVESLVKITSLESETIEMS